MRPPLLLTGGPAAGKTTTARAVVTSLSRAAVVDVDDIRQLVVAGHAAPWQGDEGLRQQRLGVENACGLALRFLGAGIEVILCDVLSTDTAVRYRRLLRDLVVVRFEISLDEARRRAARRPVHLTADEFEDLHALESTNRLPVDHTIAVGQLTEQEQARAVLQVWPDR
jgi:predicted kinase